MSMEDVKFDYLAHKSAAPAGLTEEKILSIVSVLKENLGSDRGLSVEEALSKFGGLVGELLSGS